MKTRKTKKRKNSKQFNQKFRKRFFTKKSVTVLICVVIILVAAAFGCQDLRRRAQRYEDTIEELNTEIRDLEDTNRTLEEERNNMDSDAFKEKMARERLGMIGKDEYSLQQSENSTTDSAESSSGSTENSGTDGADSSGEDGGDTAQNDGTDSQDTGSGEEQ